VLQVQVDEDHVLPAPDPMRRRAYDDVRHLCELW
jgi:hypothetical protein